MAIQQFVSVAGDSASGKTTLVKKLLDDDRSRERFGIAGLTEAFNLKGAPIGDMLASTADVIVFRWQLKDKEYIGKARATFPGRQHRVIVTSCDPQVHAQRMISKHAQTPQMRNRVQRLERGNLASLAALFELNFARFGRDTCIGTRRLNSSTAALTTTHR